MTTVITDEPRSRPEIFRMLMALLPNGRAWQSADGALSYDLDANTIVPGSTLRAFWWAVAGLFIDIETNTNQFRAESFSATVSADADAWLEEYGLPSDDDPYGTDFVTKAQARPTTDPADYAAMLAKLGWVADVRWLRGDDATFPGVFSTLHITVHEADSTALGPVPHYGHDSFHLGHSALGTPDVNRVKAIMAKMTPAHAVITTETI